jgi:hypothetical protein
MIAGFERRQDCITLEDPIVSTCGALPENSSLDKF